MAKYISKLINGEELYYLKDSEARANLIDKTEKGAASGVATLDADGKISSELIPTVISDSASISYGTCYTESNIQNKVVQLSNTNWSLKVGSVVGVKFFNTNTFVAEEGSEITLNVNGTGAKQIWYNTEANPEGDMPSVYGFANKYTFYMYDGTYWVWMNHGVDLDTTYQNMTASEIQTGTDQNARSISAKTLNDWIDGKGFLTLHQDISGKVDKTTTINGHALSDNIIITKSDVELGNVGNFKAVSTVASQGLTDTEKSNARANIGAGTSSFSGSYDDLSDKPTIPSEVTESTVSGWGFTKNAGTITGIKMNESSKGTSGVVDLGTVITAHLDISGKADKSTTVSSVGYNTTSKKITKTINGTTSDVVTAAKIVTDGGGITSHQDISGKVDKTTTVNGHALSGNVTVSKSDVGLGNVTNDAQVKRSEMGVASGVATLDSTGKVPTSLLPGYVDDVLEYDTKSAFPTTGEAGKIYVDKTTNKTWRWGGTDYVEISQSLALGETSSTAYAGDKGKALADKLATIAEGAEVNVQSDWNATEGDAFIKNKPTIPAAVAVKGNAETSYRTGNVNITPANIGLGNVNNTADANKNVASATKLTTARTLWGQSFDGTANVSGDMSGVSKISFTTDGHFYLDKYGNFKATGNSDSNNWNVCKYDGSSAISIMASSGNVGIGTTSPSKKLDVNGTLNVTGNATLTSINGVTVGNSPKFTDTTYSTMSVAEGTAGTKTTARTMRADYLKQIIQALAPQSDWNATSGDAVILNKPTSLPASDVSAWAKNPTKPVYTPSEVGIISSVVNTKVNKNNLTAPESVVGQGNSGKVAHVIYKNTGTKDYTIAISTTSGYITPDGQAIEITCPLNGYCEISYLNIGGTIYVRGL